MFPLAAPRGNIEILGKQNELFPSGPVIKCLMLEETSKEGTTRSVRSLRFPKLQTFVETFCANLESPVWSRHVGGPLVL